MSDRHENAPPGAFRSGRHHELPAKTSSGLIIPSDLSPRKFPANLLDAALAYAARGWRVIPCRPGEKRPLILNWRLRASDDPAVIRQWWAQWPDANVALLTGYGLDVLDVDVKEGREGWQMMEYVASHGLLRDPIAVIRTPSGGLHLWYRASGVNSGAVGKQRDLEFKGWGGYVLAPPSVVGGRAYETIELGAGTGKLDWAAIKRLFRPAATQGRRPKRLPYGDPKTMERLARYVANSPPGNRNNVLFWACCEARRSGFDQLDTLVEAGRLAGLPDDEIARTVASAELRQPLISHAAQGGGHDR